MSSTTCIIKEDFYAEKCDDLDALEAPIPEKTPQEFKVYKKRWFILGMFAINYTLNSMQWVQYAIITDIIAGYYGVSSTLVNWTSLIYMIVYVPFIFPGSWILDKYGLRLSAILGAAGTCIGAWIKVFSAPADMFWLAFIGQTVAGTSQVFIMQLPARIAAVWFGADQVSFACSVGVFGTQLGIALGFLLPPILVKNHEDHSLITQDLRTMFYIIAGLTSAVTISIICFFKEAPPTPPSAAQANGNALESYFNSVLKLLKNWNYMMLMLSYGLIIGCFDAISTFLNQLVLTYFEGANEDAGRIGLVMIIAGCFGSILGGILLDKTHWFKETTIGVSICSTIGMVVFTFTLVSGNIGAVYFSSFLLGFFLTGYFPIGYEFGAELTYPISEGTSSGLLIEATMIMGIILTIVFGEILDKWGALWANVSLCILFIIGTLITFIIKSDLRRQAAQLKK